MKELIEISKFEILDNIARLVSKETNKPFLNLYEKRFFRIRADLHVNVVKQVNA